MEMTQMNKEERLIWNSLPPVMRSIARVTNSYQHALEIVQNHMSTLIGERADWRRCLEHYFESDEYRNECHDVQSISCVPELSVSDIQQMIAQEEYDTSLINELKLLRQQLSEEDTRAPSLELTTRMAEILGILPESKKGLNKWLADYSGLSSFEKETILDTIRENPALLGVVVESLADHYYDGFMLRYPSCGTVLSQGKRRFYYRGENAYYRTSKASIARGAELQMPERIRGILRDLRLNEGCLFLDNFDAVTRWPLTGSVNYIALAQHYGLRTPMMDVTSDLKTALFFACCTYDSGRWRPLRNEEFEEKGSRKHVERLGGDSRYAILYRSPMDVTDMLWGVHEDDRINLITPIGYQPFMRCSAQHGYMLIINGIDYDMMQDRIFAKYRIRLTEELCQWIFEEMEHGERIYPHKDIPDLLPYFSTINTAKRFSEEAFRIVMENHHSGTENPDHVKAELERYGIFIVSGKSQYISNNRLQKINRRYSVEKALEINNVTPMVRPMLVI